MARGRGYTRRYSRRIKTVKYSNETVSCSGNWAIANGKLEEATALVVPSNVQGTRKCKNFELSLVGTPWVGTGAVSDAPIVWALVYVPQGTTPSSLDDGDLDTVASLYEPSQNVIMSGLWPANLQAPYKVKTRLARNLNSGDSIYFVYRCQADQPNGANKNMAITLNYAIAY